MAVTPKLCVLTVHGIGFQQPPVRGLPGYADVLHRSLGADLGDLLGNDPHREPGVNGPVYVMSARPGTREREWGLKRALAFAAPARRPGRHAPVLDLAGTTPPSSYPDSPPGSSKNWSPNSRLTPCLPGPEVSGR